MQGVDIDTSYWGHTRTRMNQEPPVAVRNVFSYPHISTLNIYLTNVDPGLHNLDLLTQS